MYSIKRTKPKFNLLYLDYFEHLFNSVDAYLLTPNNTEKQM